MMKATTQKHLLLWILLLALLAFFLLNACAVLVSQKYQTSIDLTQEGMYELSQTTIDVCESLDNQTYVYVFADVDEYPSMLAEMLKRYDQLSVNVVIEYYDPVSYPMMVSHYQQLGYNIGSMDMLIEGDNRIKHISYDSLLVYEGSEVTGIALEQQVTAGLLYANASSIETAVFTTGHSERSTTALQQLFEDNNFIVTEQSLALGETLEASIVVIAGPTYDFTEQETQVLSNYLASGGKVMAFFEPTDQNFDNLGGLLQTYGITVEQNVVFEQQAFMAGTASNIIPMYVSHELNTYFASNPIYVVMPASCTLTLSTDGMTDAQAVLMTTTDAYVKDDIRYQSATKSDEDKTGQFVVAAVAQSSGSSEGQWFVAGSRMIYADDVMSMSTYANGLFLTQAINYLVEEQTTVSIPAKTLTLSPLPITQGETQVLSIVLVGVLPLLAMAIGLVIKLKRRHL